MTAPVFRSPPSGVCQYRHTLECGDFLQCSLAPHDDTTYHWDETEDLWFHEDGPWFGDDE